MQGMLALAQLAYNKYAESTDWKNHLGLPMPVFPDLPERIQRAWCAAAEGVAGCVRILGGSYEEAPR